jgi:hypothetical protein
LSGQALNKLYERRLEACNNLESATSVVLRDATKAHRQRLIAEEKARKMRKKNGVKDEETASSTSQDEGPHELVSMPAKELLEDLVPEAKRPKHRTGFLGLFGTKVDSINWYRVWIFFLLRSRL